MATSRRRVILRPLADQDIDHQFEYLAVEAGVETALRFLKSLRKTLNVLRTNPEIGSSRDFRSQRLKGLRVWPVQGFRRQLLFYLHTEDSVEIVRILHAARDVESMLIE